MSACPICNKPVDSLRARNVKVRDGKIVAYCSPECLAKASELSGPTPQLAAALAAPAPAPAPTPAPAPAPAPAAVAPAPAAAPAAAKVATKPAAPVLPKGTVPKSREDLDSGPVIEILHEPASGVVTSAADPRTTPPAGLPVATTAPKVDSEKIGGRPAKVTTEIDPRDVLGEDEDDDDEDLDEVPSGSTVRRRRDSFNVKQAEDWLDDEPADVRASTAPPDERRGRGPLIALLVLALLGGGGFALYKYVYLPRNAVTQAPPEPEQPKIKVDQVEQVPPKRVEVAKHALDRARLLLQTYLKSKDSPRIQRLAALALSRTGDKAAIARLLEALDKDNLDVGARLDVGMALARAGEKKGFDVLMAGLRGSGDSQSLSAQRLAMLGDARAKEPLTNLLDSQRKLGVAKELARFADPRAIKVLEQIRGDASPDYQAEATIALVVAGKRELAGELYPLLAKNEFKLQAAVALAELHDEKARPVLVGAITAAGNTAVAARSLRRLAPDHDLTPELTMLVGKLEDPTLGKDTHQIPMAEVILLLAGPVEWTTKP